MYYMMSRAAPSQGQSALLSFDDPNDENLIWISGKRFTTAPQEPVVLSVERGEGGVLPTLNMAPVCLMVDRLAEVLTHVGVDNIDLYRAQIHDLNTGIIHSDYKAFNLIGAVSAADMRASKFIAHGGPMISVDFDHLALNPAAAHGALMFRLAESMNGIVVHETIKQAVESAGIDGVQFLRPADWIS